MKSSFSVITILALVLVGCATIMHGTTQDVSISSSPTGAEVTVNGQVMGITPLIADLKRKDKHMIHIELDGYEPFEIGLGRKTSGWVWGNIVFGGLVGLAVDAITGGLYKLSPEQVTAEMRRSGTAAAGDGTVYIITVLKPDPNWEPIATIPTR